MRIRLYKISTYAYLDTWSHGTKQSQTKPILPDLPLPAPHKTALTSFPKTTYATTPQSQKQTQTNPICPAKDTRLTKLARVSTSNTMIPPEPQKGCLHRAGAVLKCSQKHIWLCTQRRIRWKRLASSAAETWQKH